MVFFQPAAAGYHAFAHLHSCPAGWLSVFFLPRCPICSRKGKERKGKERKGKERKGEKGKDTKDNTFWRRFEQKPSSIPGCPSLSALMPCCSIVTPRMLRQAFQLQTMVLLRTAAAVAGCCHTQRPTEPLTIFQLCCPHTRCAH